MVKCLREGSMILWLGSVRINLKKKTSSTPYEADSN